MIIEIEQDPLVKRLIRTFNELSFELSKCNMKTRVPVNWVKARTLYDQAMNLVSIIEKDPELSRQVQHIKNHLKLFKEYIDKESCSL